MSLVGSLGNETVVVVHPELVEDENGANYGNPFFDWPNATRTPVEDCAVEPTAAPELVEPGRNAIVTRYLLRTPAGTALDAVDHVEWRGRTFEVDGDPLVWATGALDRVEAFLQAVRG